MIANGSTFTVTRRTQSGTDAHNNPTYTTSTHTIARCAFVPVSSDELTTAGRDGLMIVGRVICADVDVDLQSDDLVTIDDGREFEVDGDPRRWSNPHSGIGRGVEADLRKVVG